MPGSGGWAYFSATRYMLGIRPDFDELKVDPCIPGEWEHFHVSREWRGVTYEIEVENPNGVMKGVKELYVDGVKTDHIGIGEKGTTHQVKVVMGN